MAEPRPLPEDLQPPLSDELLRRFGDFIAARMGLHFPPERRRNLVAAAGAAARELGLAGPAACIEWLLNTPLSRNQIELLARHLTIAETYFLRDPQVFRMLEERILPELLLSRRQGERRLRIWSAGCASGEEPYSIAILLSRMQITPPQWNVTILGTDINPQALRRAAEGVYTEWSFRDTPPWFKEGYFRKRPDGRLEILPRLREMVTFGYLNLTEDVYPSLANNTNAMDLILCRNVLMYFVPRHAARILERFHDCLTDDGWLLVSPAEASLLPPAARFAMVRFTETLAHRKAGRGDKETRPLLPEAVRRPAVLPPTPPPSPPPPARRIAVAPPPEPYEEAVTLYGRGRYADAAERLAAHLSRRGDDPRALALLARVHANQGRFAEAGRWCEKAVAADKLDAGLHYLRALILEEQGAFEAAEKALQSALYLEPGFVLAHFALGNLGRRQGKARQAERHWRNALALLADHPPQEPLPEAEGMSAGRLREIIETLLGGSGNGGKR